MRAVGEINSYFSYMIGITEKLFNSFSCRVLPLYSKCFVSQYLYILKYLIAQEINISQLQSSGISLLPLEEGNTPKMVKWELSDDRHCVDLECHAKGRDALGLSWHLFCYQPAFPCFWSTTGPQTSPVPSRMSYQNPKMCLEGSYVT